MTIPADASHFKHRGELVYLPPAWFASTPPPRLPTVMMIGGEFNTPADWLRAGNAVTTIDEFAAAHGGNAPVLVFVDSGARSTTTPNASTAPAATPPTISPRMCCPSWCRRSASARIGPTGGWSAGRWVERVRSI
ncbi:esterase family protein [Mycobacterium xenopi 4042]|uniref:Esterase family protein n=1 Tax=Mycobacterium xenopi 4042 TaxID=1299334 RepID=X8DC34_MYCXE|nr:esterase family protein [Mycobacterium xenopi 4042]